MGALTSAAVRPATAVLLAGSLLTGCSGGSLAAVGTPVGDEGAAQPAATPVDASVEDDGPPPLPERSGTGPERTELVYEPGPSGSRELLTVSELGDVREPPRTSSVVREADGGPETSVEIQVGEVISSFAGEVTDEGTLLTLDEPILFDFDSAELRPGADNELEALAAVLEFYEDAPVQIVGHTDGRGSDAYNDELSQDRADAVRDALEDLGIDAARLSAEGVGSREPVVDEQTSDGQDDPEARAQNRRVELLIVGVEPPS